MSTTAIQKVKIACTQAEKVLNLIKTGRSKEEHMLWLKNAIEVLENETYKIPKYEHRQLISRAEHLIFIFNYEVNA